MISVGLAIPEVPLVTEPFFSSLAFVSAGVRGGDCIEGEACPDPAGSRLLLGVVVPEGTYRKLLSYNRRRTS